MNRYFVSDAGGRARRARDGVGLALGLVLLLWAWWRADSISAIEDALVALARSIPSWFDSLYQLAYTTGLLFVVALFIVAIVVWRRRSDLLRDMVLALVASVGIALILALIVSGGLPDVLPEFIASEANPSFPVLRVALVMAVISVAAPHLTRPMRRLGWFVAMTVAIAGFGLGLGLLSDVIGGVGLGIAAASTVLLVFGSPRGYPDVEGISAALQDLGLDIDELRVVSAPDWGVRDFAGRLASGEAIMVKAYGRDAVDSHWFARAWHTVWYRENRRAFTLTRRDAVTHEALAMLIAERGRVSVEAVLAVGVGGDDVALLATSFRGRPLDSDDIDRAVIAGLWRQVDMLHAAGIAHGALTMGVFTQDDEGPIVHDFSAASLSAGRSSMSLDVVSLLYATAGVVGAGEAVEAARGVLGDEELVAALSFLQPPALTRAQRNAVAKPKSRIDELRSAVAEATGAEAPEPARLRRVNPKDLIMPALSLLAAWALIDMLSDVDFGAVWSVMESASWLWIGVAFVVGQAVFLPEATAMMYAVGYPLPLRPLTVLQVSVNWIGLAVPTAAGRVAMNTVFLRNYGVSPATALTQGMIDGLAGFLVEAAILAVSLVAVDLPLELDKTGVRWGLILLIVGLLIIAGAAAVLLIRRIHEMVVPALREAWNLLWGIAKSPRRALGLLLSNLGSRLILAVALWFILQAIGTPLPLATCLVVTVATNLLAGLVPVPGGIGVAEAVLTSFLSMAGLPPDDAFAAAIVFRTVSFYIPAGEGFIAMRWLDSHGYI